MENFWHDLLGNANGSRHLVHAANGLKSIFIHLKHVFMTSYKSLHDILMVF